MARELKYVEVEKHACELFSEGLTIEAVAETVQVPLSIVRRWRSRYDKHGGYKSRWTRNRINAKRADGKEIGLEELQFILEAIYRDYCATNSVSSIPVSEVAADLNAGLSKSVSTYTIRGYLKRAGFVKVAGGWALEEKRS